MSSLTSIINKLRVKKQDYSVKYYSGVTYLFARIYGIQLGKNALFFKFSTFFMHEQSAIIIGDNCQFRSGVVTNLFGLNHRCVLSTHRTGAQIKIGNGSGLSGTTIGCATSVELGEQVMVGANSVITDFDWHSLDPYHRNDGEIVSRPVYIGDRVWIGANCLVLKGVTIGENTVVGAGSVVSSSLPANMICAGNPCKPIKPLKIFNEK
ncbi:acyltransferase [Flavihumibacter sp. UBA7668]|uniref:acyltransferase n=1 Tax=Flavihumibacter sp. UBA7668 TaxID=1946542 RepID=UPI0025BE9095|nr:acyltransferase [Flavihumibacter sp. UBA7668]